MECEARDEQVERPDSVARLLQRVPHLGRAPGFGIAKLPHGNHGEEFGDFRLSRSGCEQRSSP